MDEKPRGRGRGRGKPTTTPKLPDPDTIAKLEGTGLPEAQQPTTDQFADVSPELSTGTSQTTTQDTPKTTLGRGKTPPLVKDLKDALQQGAKVGASSKLNPQSPEFSPSSITLNAKASPFTLPNGPSGGLGLDSPDTQISSERPTAPLIVTKQPPFGTFSRQNVTARPMSKLNASAPEFIPRLPSTATVQNGTEPAFMEPEISKEEVPSFGPVDIIRGFTPTSGAASDLENEPILKAVSEMLVKGSMYVASFDRLESKLLTTVNTFPPSAPVLENLAEMLIYWGVSEPYFRYTACKTCEVLCEGNEGSNFRKTLVARMNVWYKRESSSENFSAEETYRLISFSLFFSELFTRLKIAGKPITVLAVNTFELVNALLTRKSNDTVIGACNILKLTGTLLEECGDSEFKKKMSNVIEVLKDLTTDETLSRSCTELLTRVIELSGQSWGESVVMPSLIVPSLKPPPVKEDKGKLNVDAAPFIPSTNFQVQQPVVNVEEWSEFETDYSEPVMEEVVCEFPDGDDDGLDPDIELEMEAFIEEIEEHLLMQDFDPDLETEQI